jgi:hypothetical protein
VAGLIYEFAGAPPVYFAEGILAAASLLIMLGIAAN